MTGEFLCIHPVINPATAQDVIMRFNPALMETTSAFKDFRHLLTWIWEILLRYEKIIRFQVSLVDMILGGQIRSLMCNNPPLLEVIEHGKPIEDLLGLLGPKDKANQ